MVYEIQDTLCRRKIYRLNQRWQNTEFAHIVTWIHVALDVFMNYEMNLV